jgi:gamma-glutamyltranspeptidase/glutathione hydrolase
MNETPVFSRAAVAAPHLSAAEAGRNILAEGGNAVEAMLAMASTIAVVYPHMTGIGGDGFWLVRSPDGQVHYIEACGYAGAQATIAHYRERELDRIPARGPLAALTVPGAVGGWLLAQDLAKALGGRMPLRILLESAIAQAGGGYGVSPCEARTLPKELAGLRDAPGFRQTFLVEDRQPTAGAIRRPVALADTLERLATAGLEDFYRGDVAREIAADLEKIGSPVTREDLRRYEAVTRKPLSLRLGNRVLYNSPPPTQGLASLLILGMFERLAVKGRDSFEHIHGLIEATKRALAIRDRVCTDYGHLRHDPRDLLSDAALAREAAAIDMRRAAALPIAPLDGDTVWMGAIDAKGTAVSYIQSIYWEYGSGCVLPHTGILMQNRGLAFSLHSGATNPLSPGRRPPHTLNPPLAVFDDGRILSYGSMGGDGQPQFQAQVFSRIAFGQSLADAIDAPRFLFGKTWGAESSAVKLEGRFDPGLARALEAAGHAIEMSSEAYSDEFGHAGALMRENGAIAATHDPRSDGGAAGI